MKKILIWILVLISILVLIIRYSSKMAEIFLGIKEKSGIQILSVPDGAEVFIDGKNAGKTPFDNKNLEAGQINVRLEKDKAVWQGIVRLNPNTITVINRDLEEDPASSSGGILNLEKGKGVTIISNPSGSYIEINGKESGKTPITLDLSPARYKITISHDNYIKKDIEATLPDNFNLTISVDLALSKADLTTISEPTTAQIIEVIVKQTPTGFLRIRDKPSLSGKEIGRVNPGDTLVLLETRGTWDKIRLSDGEEGYVSSSYVDKKTP